MHGIRQCDHIKSVGQSDHLDLKRNSWQDHAVLVAIMVRIGPVLIAIKGPVVVATNGP